MTPPSASLKPAPAHRRLFAVCAAATTSLALGAIWLPALPAGHDTPMHALSAAVVSDPERFADWFRVGFAPTSQTFVYLAALFGGLGAETAVRLARTAVLAALLLTGWLHDRRNSGAIGPVTVTAPLLSLTFAAAMGFDNFAVGLAFGFAAVAAARSAAAAGRPAIMAVAAALLVGTASGHAVVCAILGAWLLAEAAAAPSDRARRVQRTVVMGAPAALYAAGALYYSFVSQRAAGAIEGLGTQRLPLLQQVTAFGTMSLAPDTWWGWLAWAGIGAIALAATGRPGLRALLGTSAWAGLFVLFPYHGAGWAFAQPRVAILAGLVAIASLRAPRPGRGRAALSVVGVAALVASAALSMQDAIEQGAQTAAARATLGAGPTGRTIVVAWEVPSRGIHGAIEPTLWAHAWALTAGGATSSLQASNPGIHAARLLQPPSRWPPMPPQYISRSLDCGINPQCATEPARLADRIAVQSLPYDTALISLLPEDAAARLVTRGMLRTAHGRFVPRASRLALAFAEPSRPSAVSLRYVLPETLGPIAGGCLPAGDAPPPQTLGPLIAGPGVLEVLAHAGPDCASPAVRALLRLPVDLPPAGEAQVTVPVR